MSSVLTAMGIAIGSGFSFGLDALGLDSEPVDRTSKLYLFASSFTSRSEHKKATDLSPFLISFSNATNWASDLNALAFLGSTNTTSEASVPLTISKSSSNLSSFRTLIIFVAPICFYNITTFQIIYQQLLLYSWPPSVLFLIL